MASVRRMGAHGSREVIVAALLSAALLAHPVHAQTSPGAEPAPDSSAAVPDAAAPDAAAPDAAAPDAAVPATGGPPAEVAAAVPAGTAPAPASPPPAGAAAAPAAAAPPAAGAAAAPAAAAPPAAGAAAAPPALVLSQPWPPDGFGSVQRLRPPPVNRPLYSKEVGLGLIGGLYGVVYTWTYFAWYKNRATVDDIVWNSEGLFGPDTYAGGSDKLGHMWGNYIISRWTANILATGGWDRLDRSLIAAGTTMAFFTMIELKDGYHKGFGFSWWDMAFNMAGNLEAIAMIMWPRLDEMFDFKVYYLPTKKYLRSLTKRGVVDAGEDYSGQKFSLSYHLTSIDAVKRSPSLQWLRYLDLTLGYQTRNYLPEPKSPNTDRIQEISLGVAFDFQHLIDVLYDWDLSPRGHAQSSLRFFLEGFGVPYTNPYLIRYQKNNGPAPPDPEEEATP